MTRRALRYVLATFTLGTTIGALATHQIWLELLALAIGSSATLLFSLDRLMDAATPPTTEEVALGVVVLSTLAMVISVGGNGLLPLTYLACGVLASLFQRRAVVVVLVLGALYVAVLSWGDPFPTLLAKVVFAALFGGLYHLILWGRIRIARRAERVAVQRRLDEIEERAEMYRLVSSGTSSSESAEDDSKWLHAAVKAVEGATSGILELAEEALGTHALGAYLLRMDERMFLLHDGRARDSTLMRDSVPAQEGIFAGVMRRNGAVRLGAAEPLSHLPYYGRDSPEVRSVMAVPILEGNDVIRGVLVADRVEAQPFTEEDERILVAAAREVQRCMGVERVMTYIRSSRDEKDRFFRALGELNRAGAPEQVFPAVVESARQVAPIDFCAVTLVHDNEAGREHKIAHIAGTDVSPDKLVGLTFSDNNGLVSTVVRYGKPLPGWSRNAREKQIIFESKIPTPALHSLIVLPLVADKRVLGTLVVGSQRNTVMADDSWRMLEVIAMQAAQAVLRAQLYEQMQRLATIDALTGLTNVRSLHKRFDEVLALARRHGRKLSFVLTDVDHFKSVNDTYGHPTGDAVLRGVSKLLLAEARDTDIVARYGGEEFAIVMPETDERGAMVIAERIRERVQQEHFQSEKGPFKVTISLGISTFPLEAGEKQALIDRADECLYYAKRNGRNRAISAAILRSDSSPRKSDPAIVA